MLILTPILNRVNQIIWGNWLLFVLLGIGLLYTVLSGFVQIRHFPYIIRKTLLEPWKTKRHASSDSNSISSFQALCTAVASCVGSGNIVGVSTAVLAGGLGAIFWMWVAAFVGSALESHAEELRAAYRKLETYSENFDVRKLAACTKDKDHTFYILCGWMSETDAKAFRKELEEDHDTFCLCLW